MRIDSDMAEAVMTLLILRKGIVTLPVHDSFLVPASKRDELEAAVMQAAYEVASLSDARVTEAKQGKPPRFADVPRSRRAFSFHVSI